MSEQLSPSKIESAPPSQFTYCALTVRQTHCLTPALRSNYKLQTNEESNFIHKFSPNDLVTISVPKGDSQHAFEKNGVILPLTFHHKLQVAYGKTNVLTTMRVRRLQWDGHVERMSDDRTVKKVLLENPD